MVDLRKRHLQPADASGPGVRGQNLGPIFLPYSLPAPSAFRIASRSVQARQVERRSGRGLNKRRRMKTKLEKT
jgi:hypothetical protein